MKNFENKVDSRNPNHTKQIILALHIDIMLESYFNTKYLPQLEGRLMILKEKEKEKKREKIEYIDMKEK